MCLEETVIQSWNLPTGLQGVAAHEATAAPIDKTDKARHRFLQVGWVLRHGSVGVGLVPTNR